jgi:hypothetical protein
LANLKKGDNWQIGGIELDIYKIEPDFPVQLVLCAEGDAGHHQDIQQT